MRRALKSIAREISHDLLQDVEADRTTERSAGPDIVGLLLEQLADEVARELETRGNGRPVGRRRDARLKKLGASLARLAREGQDDDDDDDDEAGGSKSSLPNLKYAKPKYKDVQSVLKYVESDEDRGRLKLVIMNFND